MLSLTGITTSPALTFDALVAGEPGAPPVLLLHGFAELMQCWRAQVNALAGAGYRAIAPSQRGYSPGARPDTRDHANYHIDRLIDDALAIVVASGYGDSRFHLAGLDWGGSIAWAWPIGIPSGWHRSRCDRDRIRTPSIRALKLTDGDQAHRSRHHRAFLEPDAGDVVLADDAGWLRERLAAGGVPAAAIEQHLAVLGNKPAMEGALAWYRARGAIRGELGMIKVRRCTSGEMPTTRSGRSPPKAHGILSKRRIASRRFPASAISPPTRLPGASANYCWSTLRLIRSTAMDAVSGRAARRSQKG